jgi:hypothetical protein
MRTAKESVGKVLWTAQGLPHATLLVLLAYLFQYEQCVSRLCLAAAVMQGTLCRLLRVLLSCCLSIDTQHLFDCCCRCLWFLQGFVKQQLDELCDRSLMCGPARIRKLRERRRDAEQRVHAAAEREQDLQGRLYSSAAEIRQLRQQLEAARAAGRYE